MRHRHSCRVSEGDSEEEKLVEEITRRIYVYSDGNTSLENCIGYARGLITRIGKAYADGELELPGEKWRQQYGPKEVIIALRKEEEE